MTWPVVFGKLPESFSDKPIPFHGVCVCVYVHVWVQAHVFVCEPVCAPHL